MAVDDIYVGTDSLNELSNLDRSTFATKIGRSGDKIQATTYLQEAIFSREKSICARLTGGSMLGTSVKSADIIVKK